MKPVKFSHDLLTACAAQRPAGYMDELLKAKVSEDAGGITFDRSHPAYVALQERHGSKYDLSRPGAPRASHVAPHPLVPADGSKRGPQPGRAVAPDPAVWGPPLWRSLHQRPRESKGDDAAWLESFIRRIPCTDDRNCRKHFREWVKVNPPPEPLTFAWTHAAHEAVNARLGKPAMPLDDAKRLWGY